MEEIFLNFIKMRKTINLSPNFSIKSRSIKDIKYVIFHYTGMQSEIEAFKKLKDPKSKVSCHYFINRKGEIIQMVRDNKVAWHAGKSKWKFDKNLNKDSLGIELVNKGHEFGYQNFTNAQIKSLINLCKFLKKKYRIKKENFLGHSDIAPLRKLDPGEKFPWKKFSKHELGNWYENRKKIFYSPNKKKFESFFFKNIYIIGYRYFSLKKNNSKKTMIIKSFQRKYLPRKVTGKIDQKTLKISHFLANNFKLT
jgi:N-acetylmuramoyl-L-alanine amidase